MSTQMKSLVVQMSERFGVEPAKFYETLKATAFKQRDGSAPTDDQMMTLMIVAEQYRLNPFTREIYAFPDKQNGIIPVVGVDGWSRIINEHPAYDGIEFAYSEQMVVMPGAKVPCPEWVECIIYRNDRTRPTRIKEFIDEVYRAPFAGNKNGRSFSIDGPWQSHTKRQLRHKVLIQCARIAFGFGGIYDQDEAERIHDVTGEVLNSETLKTIAPRPAVSMLALPSDRQHEISGWVQRVAERAGKTNAWSTGEGLLENRFKEPSELAFARDQYDQFKQAVIAETVREQPQPLEVIDVERADQGVVNTPTEDPEEVVIDQSATAEIANQDGFF